MLVTTLGQNAANVAPTIPPRILPANTEDGEAQPLQGGGNVMTSKAQTETNHCRMRAQCRHRTVGRPAQEDREPTPKSHQT